MEVDIELTTIGQLVEYLTEIENECMDWDVVCIAPDGTSCHITSLELDEDGILCIGVDDYEYDIDDCYSVDILLNELQTYNEQTRVYIAGHNQYLKWGEGPLYEDENEEVGFDCIAFEPDKAQECLSEQLTEVERSGLAWKQFVQNIQRIVLFVITLLLVYGSVYNVRALLTHSGTAWQNIMWSFICIFLTIIGSLTLYSDYKNNVSSTKITKR